jgi:hypothetical protein
MASSHAGDRLVNSIVRRLDRINQRKGQESHVTTAPGA